MSMSLKIGDTTEQIRERLNNDAEFALKARKWEGSFKIIIGEETYVFQMHEGDIERIKHNPPLFTECDFLIYAPTEDWDKILGDNPPPFYQDIFSAWLHHDVTIEGDLEQFFGFHMALRRLFQMARNSK
ncbi:SCP2 sterol-binding domain-containing protein [Lentibacillus sp. CBA3610]|uniref:SCP2 sterol-binding domain-containing protein n=1 Tax=Lentibacillus sp. CBA3610 TaxID=2518176 RepID=UPI0015955844|nr:SCP2 sterol-binding domain-containing protein [Lentibacillus sp. CBA3610]QKY68292.1 hypothetical protein Len3610_00435 [Lentibacillus sp. CBA3610]